LEDFEESKHEIPPYFQEKESISTTKFDLKDARSRKELLISFPDYAKKEYKN